MMKRTILHIDFDSFFASCEQQDNPKLRGKPLGVTATNGRNCIIASSREAKKLGIGTASQVHIARTICPEINIVPADFNKYWKYSQKFIEICKDFSPFTEVFSIDEVFMDVTPTLHLYGGVYSLIDKIKQRIARDVGPFITVSIGVSYNKLLAKLGSGLKKPNGVVTINENNLYAVYKNAELTDMCGIGERIKLRLNVAGIYTLLDLKHTPLSKLIHEFGNVEGHFLKAIGLGLDDRPVIPYTDPIETKSVGRQYCLPQNEYNQQKILQNIYELSEEVGIKLRRLNKVAHTVGLSLGGTRYAHGRRTTYRPLFTGKEIFEMCYELYQEWKWNSCLKAHVKEDVSCPECTRGMVRRMGIWAGHLENHEALQLSILENTVKKKKTITVIDAINERFGDHTIRNGFLVYSDKLTTVPNGYMADKYERELLRVKF